MGLNGILNVNKPPGPTSFDIVAIVRRLSGEKRVGHAGTLDPSARGVLPVCLGQATRVIEYVQEGDKEYIAEIKLGLSTDTYDSEGQVTVQCDPSGITEQNVTDALAGFTGTILQAPPAFSAIKVRGRQSYDLARSGIIVNHPPRLVHIYEIGMLEYAPPSLKITVRCSRGTYIRSLANDLGQRLGCGAHLKTLVRSACGPFALENAVSLEEIQNLSEGGMARLLYPPDYPIARWTAAALDADEVRRVISGQDILIPSAGHGPGEFCRAVTDDGQLLAIMKFVPETGLWHPQKVFNL